MTGWPAASFTGMPARRKYLLTMMSVASCDQVSGTSASSILNTTDPSGLVILLDRLVHFTVENASCPAAVNFREIFIKPTLHQSECDSATAKALLPHHSK